MNRSPVIPMDELRRRYEALGKIEEMIGERSFLGRCSTFELFLDYGDALADTLRDGGAEEVRTIAPALGDLALEAWPIRPARSPR